MRVMHLAVVASLCLTFLTCSFALDGQHDVQLLGAGAPAEGEPHPAVAKIKSTMAEHAANWATMVKKGGEELSALVKGASSTDSNGVEAADEKEVKASQATFEAQTRNKERLDGIALEAGQKLTAANENVAKAKLHNSLAANSPLRAVLSNPHAWIKDPDACEPVPSCLHASMVGGGCNADKFPIDVCLNARKGEVNLCKNSVSVQENCCVTCMMEQDQACMKEKLIMAGYDHDADPATVPTSKIHKFDEECQVVENKLESEKSVPGVTNVGNYQALAQNLYTQQQAASP